VYGKVTIYGKSSDMWEVFLYTGRLPAQGRVERRRGMVVCGVVVLWWVSTPAQQKQTSATIK
jgi:hypothetical protein